MPAYNSGPFIREAIDSILGQTFTDFEFIIVNDGSTDDTDGIIGSYNDERIRYFKNESNIGNAASRNLGMEAAVGKYIAVMDSDDISVTDRLEKQNAYLEKHPDIGILGGGNVVFDENEWFRKFYPYQPEYIKSFLFFRNPIVQPSVMMRQNMISINKLTYNSEFENGEDYDLWYRASMAGIRIGNLNKVLVYHRISDSQLSDIRNIEPRNRNVQLFFRQKLALLDIKMDDSDFIVLNNFI